MTIIVAYTDGIDTWIGSDLALIRGALRTLDQRGKWVIANGWAIATAGAARGTLVQERHKEEIFDGVEDAFDLLLRVAKAYRECGMVPDTKDGAEDWGTGGLLARRGKVWEFDSELTPTRSPPNLLVADGLGWDIARGAAWALQREWMSGHNDEAGPELLVRRAIEAACDLDKNHCEGLWQGKL